MFKLRSIYFFSIFLFLLLVGILIGVFIGDRGVFLKSSKKTTLRVMTYSSFVGVFGPGREIQKEFEKICACKIKWLSVPDSTLFTQRLSLRADGFKTDMVIGLDQLSLKSARESLLWKKTKVNPSLVTLPAQNFLSDYFVPYNWSPMSFISRKEIKTPLGLMDLLQEKFKRNVSLPSPRSSTVGLQFYYWIWYVFKEQTSSFLKNFKDRLYGMSPSWSTSYALFQRGHVDLSFSYLSSLLYHRAQNQKDFYFVRFKEGHPFQVELAGVTGFCTQCNLAGEFTRFLLTAKVQNILQKKNYMFPIISSVKKDTPQLLLKSFSVQDLIQYDQLNNFLTENWLDQWDLSIN